MVSEVAELHSGRRAVLSKEWKFDSVAFAKMLESGFDADKWETKRHASKVLRFRGHRFKSMEESERWLLLSMEATGKDEW